MGVQEYVPSPKPLGKKKKVSLHLGQQNTAMGGGVDVDRPEAGMELMTTNSPEKANEPSRTRRPSIAHKHHPKGRNG